MLTICPDLGVVEFSPLIPNLSWACSLVFS
jgi:hypothetical protein